MNNIEIEQLKKDVKKYLGYSDEKIEKLHQIKETKLLTVKNIIRKIKNREHSHKLRMEKKGLE